MTEKQFDLAFKYMKYKLFSLFDNEKYYEKECKKIWLFLNKETKDFIKKEIEE